ncbi:MAG: NYN domain-containing protein [Candidatus Dormibacteria bacterium]
MSSQLRVSVLLDWQNVYERGLEAFPQIWGQPDPLKVAQFLARDRDLKKGVSVDLTSVSVFFGVASPERDPKTHGARQRQMQHWRSLTDRIHLVSRPLRYGSGMPVEKGIDVAVAIELVRCAAFEPDCDVAILFSVDTDLLPALELIAREKGPEMVEVAAWEAPGANPPLRIAGGLRIRQHRLPEHVYRACLDVRNYNLGL